MESTELLRPALAASEIAADTIRQNSEADNANESAINKAAIFAVLDDMVVDRLASGQPWLADRETISALNRMLIEMGLVEQVRAEPPTWRYTALGEELGIELFEVFMELFDESDVPFFREEYVLPSKSECPKPMRNAF